MDTLTPLGPAPRSVQNSDGPVCESCQTEIRVKGISKFVPSIQIHGRTVITTGKWLKVASIQDEELVEGETVSDPPAFISGVRSARPVPDIFTFAQKLPDTLPKSGYHVEWDNVAVIPITTYSEWWEKRVDPGVRRAVRKATKAGVVVEVTPLDDKFVEGIVKINNEVPIRQGKPFWHFQKSFEAVKNENSTYAERNAFLGAYWQGELIGYIRMTYVDQVGSILQMLTMVKHFDKKPANALIAKAVEVCEQQGMSHLMYCNYVYNDPNSSLTEFKRRNGFEKVLLPRYYIPLSIKGKIALAAGFHRGLVQVIPKPLLLQLLKMRRAWHARKAKSVEGTV
jgi:hypothetical protein